MAKKSVLDKNLGGEISDRQERIDFLKANCDGIEDLGYMKRFTPEQITEMKNELSNTSIQINDIEIEKKETMTAFKDQLKPLLVEKKQLLVGIKQKAEFVNEQCFRFVDQEAKMTGYYNTDGDLVSARPLTVEETQKTIFSIDRKTGTNN